MTASRLPSTLIYSTYQIEKLRTLWGRAELTGEQMIGHLLTQRGLPEVGYGSKVGTTKRESPNEPQL